MNPPQKLPGKTASQSWKNRLLEFVKSLQPLDNTGEYTIERTSSGWRLKMKDQSGGTQENERRPWTVRVNGVLKSVDIDSGLPEEIPE